MSLGKDVVSESPAWAKGILVVGTLVGVAYLLNKIIKGIKPPSPEEKITKSGKSNPFDYKNFLNNAPSTALLITKANATQKAIKIYDALSCYGDDEETIYSVFRGLNTQSQVAFLAKVFAEKYGKDLVQSLKGGICTYGVNWGNSGLNDSEMAIIYDIVDSKPLYNY
jgi:hypothetical protein